jgi:phosphoribosylformylglycinamidine synthase
LIEKGLVVGMQDMGAAGLTCSSCETATRSGTGIEIDVALVPQREKKMTPYEILLSESQERMLAILKGGKEKEALAILKKWKINAVKIGKVTSDRMMTVKEDGVVVCKVPAEALTKKAPLYTREAREPAYLKSAHDLDYKSVKEPSDLNKTLLQLLDSPTIASKESAYKNFKSFGKGEVLVGAGSDATVIMVKGTKKALAISVDCNGRYCYLNPYNGAMIAVAEAARNVVCSGGRPLAITDGLNFGNPMKPENYWQFEKCIEGLSAACRALDTPVISGNVSFYNENPKGAIDPSPMVGMVGLIKDAKKYLTQDFKSSGDVIVLLGENTSDLSGSEYLYLVHRMKKGDPVIDMAKERAVQEACLEAVEAGIVKSAHDCSEGGLAVALAESCISKKSKMLGATVELDDKIRKDALLFGEAQSRIVVSMPKSKLAALEKIAKRHSVRCKVLGKVGGKRLVIKSGRSTLIDLPVSKLSEAWRNAIPSRLVK